MRDRLGDVLACLDDLEGIVWRAHDGAGRPPRNPLGILKALVVKLVRNIPSDRELYRRLWSDPELRRICDIEEYEKPYHPSQLTRFRQRIGLERLESIMETILDKLRNTRVVKGEIVACDATFIKAYNKRDPKDARVADSQYSSRKLRKHHFQPWNTASNTLPIKPEARRSRIPARG